MFNYYNRSLSVYFQNCELFIHHPLATEIDNYRDLLQTAIYEISYINTENRDAENRDTEIRDLKNK